MIQYFLIKLVLNMYDSSRGKTGRQGDSKLDKIIVKKQINVVAAIH